MPSRWLAGNPKTALAELNTCVLAKETAVRYFGDWKTAIGKTIMVENKHLVKITGILDDVPANTEDRVIMLRLLGLSKIFTPHRFISHYSP
jgi:hypothetical protein